MLLFHFAVINLEQNVLGWSGIPSWNDLEIEAYGPGK